MARVIKISKYVGQAVCAATMWHVAMQALVAADVLSPAARGQAAKCSRWYRAALHVSIPDEGLPEVTRRKVVRQANAALALADRVMPEAVTYVPFIAARMEASWLMLDHLLVHHGDAFRPRQPWIYLRQVSASFFSMIWPDVGEEWTGPICAFAREMYTELAA